MIPTPASFHLLLGVTGGIAAYKTAELVRLLVKQGHSVQVVMTEAATPESPMPQRFCWRPSRSGARHAVWN